MALAAKKKGLIHVAKARLGLADDDYRAMLRRVAGVDSSAELDQLGFEAVMDELRRLGFTSDFAKRGYGFRAGMATPPQIELIRRLWSEYAGEAAGLDGWLEKYQGVSALRFLDADRAGKAITALRSMARRPKARSA